MASKDLNRNPLRIQFIFNFCAHYRKKFFEELAKKYDINYWFFSDGGEYYSDGLGSRSLGNFKGRYLRGINLGSHVRLTPGLLVEVFCRKTDVIIKCINGPVPLLLSFLAAKIRGIPFILWTGLWHDLQSPFHKLAHPLVQFIYQKSNAIVTYGDHVKAYLVRRDVNADKIFPAYQAHDTEPFLQNVPKHEIDELRWNLGITSSKVVLFIGRFVEEKGIDMLVDAFKALDFDDATLVLIGAGDKETELREKVKNLQCRILPYVENSQLYKYYALADIFVLPSITTGRFKEPWGFVVNEAMCQRCAVVVSDAVGAGQGGLIKNGTNGVIFHEKNSAELVNVLRRLLQEETYRSQLQEQALATIHSWTFENMIAGFDAAIAYALNHKNSKE